MNARGVLQAMERGIYPDDNPAFWKTCRDALRLLAAAEANDGTTPETDILIEAVGLDPTCPNAEYFRRIERERNGLAARVGELEKDAERYRWLREHTDSMSVVPPLTVARVCGWGLEAWSGNDLAAAIDAARGSKP